MAKEVNAKIQQVMDDEMIYTDFQVALTDIKNNVAPGPSGLTANMIKSWSADTQFSVYEHMNNLCKARNIIMDKG
jgi:hypothetical protein